MLPSSRRRRVGDLSDPQPQYVAVPTNCSSSTGEVPNQNQNQNLAQNPDRDQTDFINNLPNCVTSYILSFLPIQDAIRTSILSSRWRDLWKLSPLHLDDSSIDSYVLDSHKTAQTVACIVSTHPGPIHSCHISQFPINSDVDAVIENLTRKGIRDCDLSFGYQDRLWYGLPLSLLHCRSLVKASLSHCYFQAFPVVNSSLPNLKELTLQYVLIWDDLLLRLLKSCTQLEVLQLIYCTGLHHVRINFAKLQKLTICESHGDYIERLEIENAPELRELFFSETMAEHTRISVQHVNKLESLGFFSMDSTIQIGCIFSKLYNQYKMSVNESMKLPSITELSILVDFSSASKCSLFAAVLRCLPCLRFLVIKSIGPDAEVGFWSQQIPFGCLQHHLRTVTIFNSVGERASLEFVKFIAKHGQVLERINVICGDPLGGSPWDSITFRRLRLQNHALTELLFMY